MIKKHVGSGTFTAPAALRARDATASTATLAAPPKLKAAPTLREPYDATRFILTMLWSADPELVRRADEAGVDRIGLDLEVIGKAERQANLNTWVSAHAEAQLPALREVVRRGQLFCRTNPIHPDSKREIDRLIAMGADVLMLPYFRTVGEAQRFIGLVDGRATTVLLVEHCDAARQIEQIVAIPGVDEIHVGLTDLSLSLKVASRFSLMTSPLLHRVAAAVHGEGMRLCVAGIGRAMDTTQPIHSDLVYSQYPRLGATGALVSRAFFGKDHHAVDVAAEIARCRQRMAHWQAQPAAELEAARVAFVEKVGPCTIE